MDTEQLFKTLKIVIILAVIIGAIGALFYLIFGFTTLWQAMAAGMLNWFLLVTVFILLALAIYLYFKMLIMRRKLTKCRKSLENSFKIKNIE